MWNNSLEFSEEEIKIRGLDQKLSIWVVFLFSHQGRCLSKYKILKDPNFSKRENMQILIHKMAP